jgi:protein-L-isoaspartate(D-aspartate) O-methyltransferase
MDRRVDDCRLLCALPRPQRRSSRALLRPNIFPLAFALALSACRPVDSDVAPPATTPPTRAADEAASTQPAPPDVPSSAAPTDRPRPRDDSRRAERERMVHEQIAARGVSDPAVLTAMKNVPREWFMPQWQRSLAYADSPLAIGEGQTISQPYIVAMMTESLRLDETSRVLEIGTGLGYQAAVLAEITPHVFTIEIVPELAAGAQRIFAERGYSTIRAKEGDGYAGWPEHAPFDAIIVTCAPDHIPPRLLEQLAPGGRMCIPVGDDGAIQHLVLVSKRPDGTLDRKSLLPVRFVPMTGDAQRK